jgi:hypothetical protein
MARTLKRTPKRISKRTAVGAVLLSLVSSMLGSCEINFDLHVTGQTSGKQNRKQAPNCGQTPAAPATSGAAGKPSSPLKKQTPKSSSVHIEGDNNTLLYQVGPNGTAAIQSSAGEVPQAKVNGASHQQRQPGWRDRHRAGTSWRRTRPSAHRSSPGPAPALGSSCIVNGAKT